MTRGRAAGGGPQEARNTNAKMMGLSPLQTTPSFESSACSDPDTVTNYGIARALNAEMIVPNADIPIATKKDR